MREWEFNRNVIPAWMAIDDEVVPCPANSGIAVSDEKIWSDNAGRLADTLEMAGTIRGIKHKYDIKWGALSQDEARVLRRKLSSLSPFHKLQFMDIDGDFVTVNVYFGTPSFGMYSWAEGIRWIINTTCSAIER